MLKPIGMALYVEDDPTDRFLMQLAFAAAGGGARLQMVPDGEEAMKYLRGTGEYANRWRYPTPDLILLDLKLPGFTGIDVVEWIRSQKEYASVPTVVLTASRDSADQARAIRMGADDFRVKPASLVQLKSTVAEWAQRWLCPTNAPKGAPQLVER